MGLASHRRLLLLALATLLLAQPSAAAAAGAEPDEKLTGESTIAPRVIPAVLMPDHVRAASKSACQPAPLPVQPSPTIHNQNTSPELVLLQVGWEKHTQAARMQQTLPACVCCHGTPASCTTGGS